MGMRGDYGIDIGRRIKDAREERRMTQGELGRQFGVPFQMVQRWEQGGQLTIERIVAIAIVLKLDSTWLISGQYGIKPELCRALSETSSLMDRAQSATELMDTMKLRDKLRRQIDPLLGVQPLPMTLTKLLQGLMLTFTLVSLF
jgi:transcriptional regulator with XRE-family HTH domain